MRCKKPSIKGLKAKAWKLFSLYIKRKYANQDGYVECYTCDKVLRVGDRDCHVGHCFNKEAYPYLFWIEDNVRPQCYRCNKHAQGDAIVFWERLKEEIGDVDCITMYAYRNGRVTRDHEWYYNKIKELQEMLACQETMMK